MLRRTRGRLESEKGFTLIELLVVILIIGILAAIALTLFLSQRTKGQDAEAKSNARNLVAQMESCHAEEDSYTDCETSSGVTGGGLPLGGGNGQVDVTVAGTDNYTILADSKSNNSFTIVRAGGTTTRSCDTDGEGGCPASGLW